MRQKIIFRTVMASTIPIFVIGVALHSKTVMSIGYLVFISCMCTAGIKGFIDPINFDWDILGVNYLPKTSRGLKYHILWVRVKSVILVCIGLILLYLILFGKLL